MLGTKKVIKEIAFLLTFGTCSLILQHCYGSFLNGQAIKAVKQPNNTVLMDRSFTHYQAVPKLDEMFFVF